MREAQAGRFRAFRETAIMHAFLTDAGRYVALIVTCPRCGAVVVERRLGVGAHPDLAWLEAFIEEATQSHPECRN